MSTYCSTELDQDVAELKYRQLFENSPFAFLAFDAYGVITACNSSFLKGAGLQREQVLGLCLLELPDTELASKAKAALGGNYGYYEGNYHLQEAQRTTPVRVLFVPLVTDDGRHLGGFAIIEDLTERKRLEAELYSAGQIIGSTNTHFSLLAENLPLAVSMFDAEDYRLQYVNKALQQASGLPKEKLIGSHLQDVGGSENFELVQRHTEIAKTGQSVAYENYFETVAGKSSTST